MGKRMREGNCGKGMRRWDCVERDEEKGLCGKG